MGAIIPVRWQPRIRRVGTGSDWRLAAVLRVEAVRAGRVERHPDVGAALPARRHQRAERQRVTVGGRARQRQKVLGAERLVERHPHGEGSLRLDPHVLGTEADRGGAARQQRTRQQVHLRAADEAGDEQRGRARVDLRGRADLFDPARVEHGHARRQGHRLELIVRDVDDRHGQAGEQRLQLGARVLPQQGVEVRQRLVEQEERRLAHERPGEGDPLPLTARQGDRPPVEQGRDAQPVRDPADTLPRPVLRDAAQPERDGDVLVRRHVRVERVALEDHGDVAGPRIEIRDPLAADEDVARVGVLQSGDQPEQRRLAASGGPEHGQRLAVVHRARDAAHGVGVAAGVSLVEVDELQRGHEVSIP